MLIGIGAETQLEELEAQLVRTGLVCGVAHGASDTL